MSDVHFEIERKFLIRMPDLSWLEKSASKTEITQTYLIPERAECTERVRKRGLDGNFVFTHTSKERLSDMRCIEDEREIDRETYERLLERADPGCRVIEKTRYCLPCAGRICEIDVFPFWKDRAFLEIELEDEKQPFSIPPQIDCIRDVTADRRYSNAGLAREIPFEDIEGG
ncbi:MAG: hypothetical protein K6G17_03395 [Oscillospiraceae bacterium]|nr:hypothetical protein [Oscillospiraceae bacterium]